MKLKLKRQKEIVRDLDILIYDYFETNGLNAQTAVEILESLNVVNDGIVKELRSFIHRPA